MRNNIRRLVALLDGQPTGAKGQSLVELSLTAPIFIIMLVGLVEIGWFANNYLIISDVVRSAGRFASLRDPNAWVEGNENKYEWMDCNILQGDFSKFPGEGITGSAPPWSIPGFSQGLESNDLGFYDGAACTALTNMAPLEFDDTKDDIIISVFSYAQLTDCNQDGTTGDRCLVVTGRYPVGQNECADDPGDYRDPFNWDTAQVNPNEETANIDAGAEYIRGYVFRGNHFTTENCRGSRYNLQWMEERLRGSLVDVSTPNAGDQEIRFIPNYGLVLVEFSFHSNQLLGLPFFTAADPIRIHGWAIFPVSAAEPDF
ncbi:MAG: pilus assembly protein [Anaerolineae bacterium]|nr:pilus assembly protein [Anaerolineae bacterium]